MAPLSRSVAGPVEPAAPTRRWGAITAGGGVEATKDASAWKALVAMRLEGVVCPPPHVPLLYVRGAMCPDISTIGGAVKKLDQEFPPG